MINIMITYLIILSTFLSSLPPMDTEDGAEKGTVVQFIRF